MQRVRKRTNEEKEENTTNATIQKTRKTNHKKKKKEKETEAIDHIYEKKCIAFCLLFEEGRRVLKQKAVANPTRH